MAQMPSAQAPLPLAMPAGLVGVVAAARGAVEIAKSGEVGRVAGSGEAIYLGDEVRTDAGGQLQILLLDETVFTIGPNSAIVIDTFVYDPATHDGKIDARVLKGVFRFITGQIAHKKPSNVEVKLPTGSVGVRGTIFYGKVEGNSATVLLLGPGEKNNTGHRQGRIIVSNDVNGKNVETEVKKSGFGSFIEGENIPPSPAFEIPKEEIQAMISAVNPVYAPGKTEPKAQQAEQRQEAAQDAESSEQKSENAAGTAQESSSSKGTGEKSPAAKDRDNQKSAGPRPVSGPGVPPPAPLPGVMPPPPMVMTYDATGSGALVYSKDSATTQAGQDGVSSYTYFQDLSTVTQINTLLADTSTSASLDIGDQQILNGSGTGGSRTQATYDQLRARTETGVSHYQGSGIMGFGSYTLQLDIDFGNKHFGGGNSKLMVSTTKINGGTSTNMVLPGLFSFSSLSGDATASLSVSNSGTFATGTLTLNFVDAGSSLNHSLSVLQSANTDSGQGTADLKSGPSV